MADKSAIEWTDATWSPVTGCTKASAGCKHCYAEREVEQRWSKNPKSIWFGRAFTDIQCHAYVLDQPMRWKKPKRIFVCPRADLFHESVPESFIRTIFDVMAACPQHTFQILTKRARRMQFLLWSEWDWKPAPNIWIGVSIEDQATADERIPLLLQTPAEVRWVSAEPLLGPVDLSLLSAAALPRGSMLYPSTARLDALQGGTWGESHQMRITHTPFPVQWVVAGGESGPKARPMHPDWARSLRDQCAAAGVPFLFKQWGEWAMVDHLPDDKKLAGEHLATVPIDGGQIRTRQEGWLDPTHGYPMARVGARNSGRLLDEQLHDGYPTTRT